MADNSDSLEDAVRRCVREELNTHGNVTSQTLVNRTRNLIRSSASFSARQLGETGEQQSAFLEMHQLCLLVNTIDRLL